MVAVILTGGTIASGPGEGDGRLAPTPAANAELLELLTDLGHQIGAAVRIEAWRDAEGRPLPLLDSCDIGPPEWTALARLLARDPDEGAVVAHGTDTLAYTGAALSFALAGRSGPVVLTGAQRPLAEDPRGAAANLGAAVRAAADPDFRGRVLIAFGGDLLQANRATKQSSRDEAGFRAWNAPAGTPPRSHGAFRPAFCPDVIDWPVTPGLTLERTAAAVRAAGARGVVFRLYGAGAAPAGLALDRLCRQLHADGLLCVGVSAAPHGGLAPERYAATRALAASPLILADAMSPEAALVKLMWALGAGGDRDAAERLFRTNIAGELDRDLA